MSTTLPAGKYYIGDPCYVFDKKWNGIGNEAGICDVILDYGVQVFEGRPFFAAHTAYGDGGYPGSNGFTFGVDAGLLGAVPAEMFEKQPDPRDGVIVDAPNGLIASEEGGTFIFKVVGGETIVIDTKGGGDDEDDEYNEDEDE